MAVAWVLAVMVSCSGLEEYDLQELVQMFQELNAYPP
jgi:hypothetical protein